MFGVTCAAGFFAVALFRLASALCYDYGFPGPGAVCNVSPDSTAFLETLEVVAENSPGECQAADAPFGGQYYEKAKIVYTGINGGVSTVSALNTISDVTPALIGTYTFSYPVPHTSISAGSPVTAYVVYSIPGFGDFATSTSVWTEIHQPTVVATASTTTITTPLQIFTTVTSTLMTTSTSTITPPQVSSTTTASTQVNVAPTPTTTTTITITPAARTVHTVSFTTKTKTLTCFPGPGSWSGRRLWNRQAPSYLLPDCGPVSTSTVYTATVTAFAASTTTLTDTVSTTATVSATTSLEAQTATVSVTATAAATTTPPAVVTTTYARAPRPTTTRTVVVVVEHVVLPLGKRTPLCGRSPSPPRIPPPPLDDWSPCPHPQR